MSSSSSAPCSGTALQLRIYGLNSYRLKKGDSEDQLKIRLRLWTGPALLCTKPSANSKGKGRKNWNDTLARGSNKRKVRTKRCPSRILRKFLVRRIRTWLLSAAALTMATAAQDQDQAQHGTLTNHPITMPMKPEGKAQNNTWEVIACKIVLSTPRTLSRS